jgi:hypothetical protein
MFNTVEGCLKRLRIMRIYFLIIEKRIFRTEYSQFSTTIQFFTFSIQFLKNLKSTDDF